jgi:hypothetical protein
MDVGTWYLTIGEEYFYSYVRWGRVPWNLGSQWSRMIDDRNRAFGRMRIGRENRRTRINWPHCISVPPPPDSTGEKMANSRLNYSTARAGAVQAVWEQAGEGMLGPRREKVAGGVRSFIIYTLPLILLGLWNQGLCGGRGMSHAWERRWTPTKLLAENLKGKDHLDFLGVHGWIILS